MASPNVTYIVTDMEFCLEFDRNNDVIEYKTEKAALKRAKQKLADSEGQDSEIWIWRLSHVLSKPALDPVIDKVRGS